MNNDFFHINQHFPSKKTGWRCRVKLIIGPKSIGLYKPGTHEIRDACSCPDHHPIINEILQKVKKLDLEAYDEKTQTGIFRAIQITVDPKTEKAQVAFSVAKRVDLNSMPLPVASLWLLYNPKQTNTLFSGEWQHVKGETHLPVILHNKTFFFHPAAFIQANLGQFEKAISYIQESLPPGDTLAEYYAGIGVIGMLLAPQLKKITCIELNPFAEECFNKSSPPSNVSFLCEATENAITPADIAFLDPPRKGVSIKPLYLITSPHIIYMSCNPKTFARDAKFLQERGYILHHCVTFDFFPGTGHLEVLGYFTLSER